VKKVKLGYIKQQMDYYFTNQPFFWLYSILQK